MRLTVLRLGFAMLCAAAGAALAVAIVAWSPWHSGQDEAGNAPPAASQAAAPLITATEAEGIATAWIKEHGPAYFDLNTTVRVTVTECRAREYTAANEWIVSCSVRYGSTGQISDSIVLAVTGIGGFVRVVQ